MLSTDETIDKLGRLIDTVDNFAVYLDPQIGFSIAQRLHAFKTGLYTIRREIMDVYTELGGEDVWPSAEVSDEED